MSSRLPEKTSKALLFAVATFIVASLFLIILGFYYYHSQKKNIIMASENELRGIAEFKIRMINNWREERLGDAKVVLNNGIFAINASKYLADPTETVAKNNISLFLKAVQRSYNYSNILLLDHNKKITLVLDKYYIDYGKIHSGIIDEVKKKKDIVLSNVYVRGGESEIHIAMIVPIIISYEKKTLITGFVMIITDPHLRLYPAVNEWPLSATEGESLLVQREGNEVVFLNKFRHGKDGPVTIRRSLSDTDLPAVKAVRGREGIVEGIDYRNKEVVSAVKPVPNSSWFLVVKSDKDEIYTPIKKLFWATIFVVLVGIYLLAVFVAYVWRAEQAKFYRRQYETEYRRAFLYARGLIETSLDPMVTISTDGKIMDVNKSTELATGFPREILIGSDFPGYFTDLQKADAAYKLAFSHGIIRDYPLSLRNKDGHVIDVLYNASIYKNESGEVQGIFAAARDVTERKRVERDLQDAHDELEIRVKERTEDLRRVNESLQSEINLRIDDKKLIELRTILLEETNKELESFSYSVSHDLRAPLRAIDGYARMILRDQMDKLDMETKRRFNLIRQNTQTMATLIDNLLSFSRLSRMEINMTRLDMEGLINDVWKEMQIINPDNQVKLEIDNISPGYGDRSLIRQVYSNLLSNAVKYTRLNKKACIETGCFLSNGENIYYVKDNGIGFNMDYYDKLFGVFQRLHSSEEYEGTGVGLAIVQRIIHRHGGRAWAESEEGRGATFYFTLSKNN